MQILTRCQGDRCVVNNGEGLTAVDFGGGDIATVGMIELTADRVGKVPLLVGADATVVVHKEDGLVQKNASVEELRKPTGGLVPSRVIAKGEDEEATVVKVCFPFFPDFKTTMLRSLLWRCRDNVERDLHRREATELLL
ncbi:hypothetical protein B296_00035433 [Ensete ventricosum]|uniref:Uncharacterized protein n=1 Tax=Ensete ventricosum TaxID=4639 RepID=A0A426ZPC3_ENSVE|nr:hypothetical protein B296_00035433 [Ensete ventricosum]